MIKKLLHAISDNNESILDFSCLLEFHMSNSGQNVLRSMFK